LNTPAARAAAYVPGDARVIDAKGHRIIPGLADLHVHLQGGWNGVDNEILGYQHYLNGLALRPFLTPGTTNPGSCSFARSKPWAGCLLRASTVSAR